MIPVRFHDTSRFATVTGLLLAGAAPLLAQDSADSKASAPQDASQAASPVRGAAASQILAPLRFRSIGPAGPGGRIDDIAVSESDPRIIYLGYAVGGVFKSENNGTTFKPVFETYGSASIGDIAIHPTNPNIVYVGTGEPNNRQTSSFGDGIYKTTDGGKTFTNIGLKETQTIARIVIDPKQSRRRLRRVAWPPVRTEPRARHLQDHRRRQDLEQDQVHRREHRLHRHRDRSVEQQHALRGELSAAAQRMLLQRRRPGQRALEDDRRGTDVDEADRQRTAGRHIRPHRARCRALEPERRLRADRGRRELERGAARRDVRERGDGGAAAAVGAADTTGATTAARLRPRGGGRGGARRLDGPRSRRRSIRREAACFAPTQGTVVDAREQLQRAADVLQPTRASIRRTQRRSTSPGLPARSRSTAARRSPRSSELAATANRGTSTSTRSGSIRRTRATS